MKNLIQNTVSVLLVITLTVTSWSQTTTLAMNDNSAQLKYADTNFNTPVILPSKKEFQEKAFMLAASSGDVEAIKQLAGEGADLNVINSKGETPLYAAAKNGHTETVNLLLALGADINLELDCHGTALSAAAEHNHLATVKLLVDKGANVNYVSESASSPLTLAAINGNHGIMKYLVSEGAYTGLLTAECNIVMD